MHRISTLGWRFAYEGVFDARTVAAKRLSRLLSPEVAAAGYTLLTDEIVLFEERDSKFFLCDFHFFHSRTHNQYRRNPAVVICSLLRQKSQPFINLRKVCQIVQKSFICALNCQVPSTVFSSVLS